MIPIFLESGSAGENQFQKAINPANHGVLYEYDINIFEPGSINPDAKDTTVKERLHKLFLW